MPGVSRSERISLEHFPTGMALHAFLGFACAGSYEHLLSLLNMLAILRVISTTSSMFSLAQAKRQRRPSEDDASGMAAQVKCLSSWCYSHCMASAAASLLHWKCSYATHLSTSKGSDIANFPVVIRGQQSLHALLDLILLLLPFTQKLAT